MTMTMMRIILRRTDLYVFSIDHITMPELVNKLAVPPGKRTEEDCNLMATALYVFVLSIAACKDGLLISSQHANMALLSSLSPPPPSPVFLTFDEKYSQDFLERMRSQ